MLQEMIMWSQLSDVLPKLRVVASAGSESSAMGMCSRDLDCTSPRGLNFDVGQFPLDLQGLPAGSAMSAVSRGRGPWSESLASESSAAAVVAT